MSYGYGSFVIPFAMNSLGFDSSLSVIYRLWMTTLLRNLDGGVVEVLCDGSGLMAPLFPPAAMSRKDDHRGVVPGQGEEGSRDPGVAQHHTTNPEVRLPCSF